MENEKLYSPISGYLGLVMVLLLIGLPVLMIVFLKMIWAVAEWFFLG